MEITLVNTSSLRLKGKQVTLVVNPTGGKGKLAAEAALFFGRSQSFDLLLLENAKLIIDGAGEYEIGGVKITGIRANDTNGYDIVLDGIDIFVAKASMLAKMKDIKEAEIVVIEADTLVNQSVIAALNANVTMFYGEQAAANVKALGKEEQESISKYAVTRDKIPADAQILLLG